MSKEGEVTVEDTNLESLQSKLSLVHLGYRIDPFLKRICGRWEEEEEDGKEKNEKKRKVKTRSPSVNLGYFARTLAMESTFEKMIVEMTARNSKFQVLSVGAGFDTSFFRLRNAGLLDREQCQHYYEVDFPGVTKRKAKIILQCNSFKSIVSNFGIYNRFLMYPDGSYSIGNYSMIACDVTQTDLLHQKLTTLNFDPTITTIILVECSLTYIDPYLSSKFFTWAMKLPQNPIIINYEQIRPNDQFGKIMMKHFISRQSPLKCVTTYPSLNHHEKRFANDYGFKNVMALDLNSVIKEFLGHQDLNNILKSNDMFDEYEEFFQKCGHYVVLVTNIKSSRLSFLCSLPKKLNLNRPCFKAIKFCDNKLENDKLQRFGHSAVMIEPNDIYIVGGFSAIHSRDNLIYKLNRKFEIIAEIQIPTQASMFMKGDFNLFFGGRGSPNNPSNQLFKIKNEKVIEIRPKSENTTWPCPRWKHSFNYIKNSSVYILIGGKNRSTIFNDVSYYNDDQSIWVNSSIELPFPLHSHSTVILPSKDSQTVDILISGGLKSFTEINNQIIKINYNFINNKEEITTIEIPNLIPRFSHTSHYYKNHLYLIGGVSTILESGIAIVNILNNSSMEYKIDCDGFELFYNHCSWINSEDNSIEIIGGGGNCFSFGKQINEYPIKIKFGN